jgi:hypothetical protein
MKTLIATMALVASTSSFAFFDDGNTYGGFVQDGRGNAYGNGTGVGSGDFTMEVEAEGKTYGSFAGDGKHNGNFYGNGYASDRNEDGSLVSGTDSVSNADVAGNGAGEGKFKMKIGMKARADMNANSKFDANNNVNANGYGYGYDTPYYGQRPYAFEAK